MKTFYEFLIEKYPLWKDKNLNDFHVSVQSILNDYNEYLIKNFRNKSFQDENETEEQLPETD